MLISLGNCVPVISLREEEGRILESERGLLPPSLFPMRYSGNGPAGRFSGFDEARPQPLALSPIRYCGDGRPARRRGTSP